MDSATNQNILRIETLALNAWPARDIEMVGGWRLRANDGVTDRANSVWPNGPLADAPLDELIEQAERFYRERNLLSRFQISPVAQPVDLDEQLAERGYEKWSPTLVQVAPLAAVLESTPGLRSQSDFALEIAESWDNDSERDWFAIYRSVGGYDERSARIRRNIIRRLCLRAVQPVALATLRLSGEPVAVGLGAVEAEWVGLYSMATLPSARRRGAATAILRTLSIWAAQLHGVTRAYLQVEQENHAAQALYARAGFATLYGYHYRLHR